MIETLIRHLLEHECPVPHMYLDIEGNVTIGVGHLIPSAAAAAALALFWRLGPAASGVAGGALRPASEAAKRRAWRAVKAKRDRARRGHTAFRNVTRLIMSDDEVAMLRNRDIGRTRRELAARAEFRRYETFPADAQLALIDMAFNLGVAGLGENFPKFSAAVARRNWKVAAAESHRKQPNERRNNQVRAWLEQAAEREPFFLNRACAVRLEHLHV